MASLIDKADIDYINEQRKVEKLFQVNSTSIIRKTFLSEIDDDIIKMAETEYFGYLFS